MIACDASASLRTRPFGPPLRGRAALRGGIKTGWLSGCPKRTTGAHGFHLKFTGPWSKNGVRRIGKSNPSNPTPEST